MKIFKTVKNIDGFSFIEALITVVIVGIIIVPISTIFMGAIQDNIEAKEKLRTTQLAQLVVENVKAKSESDFMNFFPSGTLERTIVGNEGSGIGLSTIPDGYKIRISYNKGAGFNDYVSNNEAVINYDGIITFDENIGKNIKVHNNAIGATFVTDLAATTRILIIEYDLSTSIKFLNGNTGTAFTTDDGSTIQFVKNTNNIKIELKDTKTYPSPFDTRIYIKNKSLIPVNLYIFEEPGHQVNLSINDTKGSFEGETRIYYNMKNGNPSSHKLYQYIVEILNSDDEVLTKLEGTKIDE